MVTFQETMFAFLSACFIMIVSSSSSNVSNLRGMCDIREAETSNTAANNTYIILSGGDEELNTKQDVSKCLLKDIFLVAAYPTLEPENNFRNLQHMVTCSDITIPYNNFKCGIYSNVTVTMHDTTTFVPVKNATLESSILTKSNVKNKNASEESVISTTENLLQHDNETNNSVLEADVEENCKFMTVFTRLELHCFNLTSVQQLRALTKSIKCPPNFLNCHRKQKLFSFHLSFSELDYFPAYFFKRIKAEEIYITHTNVKTLTSNNSSTTSLSLDRSSITKLQFENFIVSSKDHSGFLAIAERLQTLHVLDYTTLNFVNSFVETAGPFKNLTALKFSNLPHLPKIVTTSKFSAHFPNLKSLTLDKLHISSLNTHYIPKTLNSLAVTNNNIRTLAADFLDGFSSLRVLDLTGNKLRTLKNFINFKGFLTVRRNPLVCDRRLIWLKEKLEHGVLHGSVQCSTGNIIQDVNLKEGLVESLYKNVVRVGSLLFSGAQK